MSSTPVFNFVRIIPRDTDFLDRRRGSRGEVFYDRETDSLRLFDGNRIGGFGLAVNDLSNVSNADFLAKATSAGVGSGSGGGNTTVTVSDELPESAENGNLWLNTNNGVLYVYVDDGDSEQWIQPAVPTVDLSSLSAVATSGDYDDLTNTPNIPATLTDLGVADGTPGQFLQTDGSGNFSFQDISADIGSFLFTGTNIDTDDSSGITVTPAVTFRSDVIVENEIVSNFISVSNINVTGNFTSTGSGTPEIVSDNEIFLTPGTTTILNGLTTFSRTTEIVNIKTGATGVVDHDFSTGALFLHSNLLANFTVNIVNMPTTNNRSTSIALFLDQGATAFIPNALQINGSAQTIQWSGGSPPSGTNNYLDIVNFTLLRANNTWTVIGSLSTYN